jgi:GAF domain-containing protein
VTGEPVTPGPAAGPASSEGSTTNPAPASAPEASLAALRRVAAAAAVAQRLQGDVEHGLLRSVVDAAASLFDAAAASIAVYDAAIDRLVFRVAAGAQGASVVGVSVPPGAGIVGSAFSSGEAIALVDVAADPRFDLATAQRTGYVPRSLAAVPLVDGDVRVGVLQVLDKRSAAGFSERDMRLLEAFARQAAAAIEAARAARDSSSVVAGAIASVADGRLDAQQLDVLLESAVAQLDDDRDDDRDGEAPFWGLVDRVAQARQRGESDAALAGEVLDIVARHLGPR